MAEKPLSQLCRDRFEPLKPYFEGIYWKDLSSFEEDDFLSAATPPHRLLMRLFVRTNQLFASSSPSFSSSSSSSSSPSPLIIVDHAPKAPDTLHCWPTLDECFDKSARAFSLADKITPRCLERGRWRDAMPKEFTTCLCGVQLDFFSLAQTGIHDAHLPGLVEFLHKVLPGCYDEKDATSPTTASQTPESVILNTRIVDLSNNRLHGVGLGVPMDMFDLWIVQLLQRIPPDGFLDVTFNPMCSVDKKSFFAHLFITVPTLALKLIWIPLNGLFSMLWHVLVPRRLLSDGDLASRILSQHQVYYEQIKALKGASIQNIFME